jgi:hypothetical protein
MNMLHTIQSVTIIGTHLMRFFVIRITSHSYHVCFITYHETITSPFFIVFVFGVNLYV